jgi:hypothetical protein
MAIRLQRATLYLRVDKKKKDGRIPLYVRFRRIDGEEPKFPIGIDLLPEEWDSERQNASDPDIDLILQKEITRIRQEVRKLELEGIEITKERLREIVSQKQAKAERPENQSFYAYYNDYVSKRRSTGKIRESTLKGYETTLKSLREFRAEIRIKDVSAKLLSDFEKFLIKRGEESGRGDVKGSRYNRIKHIRAVIKYIEAQNIPIKNPYRTGDLALPEDIINDVFLEEEEVKRLYLLLNKVEVGSKQYRVLVMYLFSCATALRIGDALAVKWRDLDVNRNPIVLGIKMQKVKKPLYVPLPPLAEEMLEFAPEGNLNNVEKGNHIFYHYGKQAINETLRELARMAEIDKRLTYHSSRRTFATLASAKGVPLQDLKQYMGHSSSKTTERYIKWSPTLAEQLAKKVKLFDLKELLKKK